MNAPAQATDATAPPHPDLPLAQPGAPTAKATDANADPIDGRPVTPSVGVALTRTVAIASLVALIVLGLAWELWLAPVRPGGSWLAIKVLPLCIPLAGLLKNRMYTYRWVSLLVWLYFTEGVVRAWSDRAPSAWYALGQTVLCVILFVACVQHVRLRQRKATSP